MQQNTLSLRHQNFMLAVRHEMGWPGFKPANDAIAFCTGRRMDFAVGSEMARIAQTIRKDAVYTGWKNMAATKPLGFTIVFREMLTVDIVDHVVPYAANDDVPIIFVSTRADEHFSVDQRGSLVRLPGRPAVVGVGRRLAMKRIRATAATMGNEMLGDNLFVPPGGDLIEQETLAAIAVRFA